MKNAARPWVQRWASRRLELPPEVFRLERDAEDFLTLEGIRLSELAERYGSPLFVVDEKRLVQNARDFLHVPPGAAAGVECYYSYKTNPVPAVLSLLHAHGVGAEVISEYELWLARKLGVSPERIVLNGPSRSRAMLETAIAEGSLIHINHREEVARLAAIARALGKRARVGLRVVLSNGWGAQFGEPIAGGHAFETFREMQRYSELEILALHTHLGGEISTAGQVRQLCAELLVFRGSLRANLGLSTDILDFGGSLGSPTTTYPGARNQRLNRTFAVPMSARSPDSVLSIREYVAEIVHAVEQHTRTENSPRPRLLVEPGRALTASTQLLLGRVVALKATGAAELTHAILDVGVNIAEPLRSEYHPIYVSDPPSRAEQAYRLVGPICTPMDTLSWAIRLPELGVGTRLAIMDAGAYFVPFSTSFSFPQPGIALVRPKSISGAAMHATAQTLLVRRPENFEDVSERDWEQLDKWPNKPGGTIEK